MFVNQNIKEIEDKILHLENDVEFNLNSYEIVSEGFVHTIYHFIVKVFNFIKNGLYKIWKFIINIIKAFIQKAKQILGKLFNSESLKNKEYKADFSFSENTHIKTYSNFNSLQNDYIKAINDITKTMEYHYKQNIENINRSEKEIPDFEFNRIGDCHYFETSAYFTSSSSFRLLIGVNVPSSFARNT